MPRGDPDSYGAMSMRRLRKCHSGNHEDCIEHRNCPEGRRLWLERQERAELKAYHDLHGIPDDWGGEVNRLHRIRAFGRDSEDEIRAAWPKVH